MDSGNNKQTILGLSPISAIALLIVLGLIPRLLCVVILDIKPGKGAGDASCYFAMASNLYDGNGIVDTMERRAFMSAGYPIFLYCIFVITGKSIIAAQYANVMLGGLSILLVYLIGREIFRSCSAAFFGAVLWAIYLPSILYTEYLLKENLMIPLLLSQILLLTKFKNNAKQKYIVSGLGVLLGIQAIVGPAALAIMPVIISQILIIKNPIKQKLRNLVILGVCMAIPLTPWLYRNYNLFGRPLLNNNGGFNLYIGNNPSATGMFISIVDTPIGDSCIQIKKECGGEAGINAYLKSLAIKHIRSNPMDTLFLSLKKMVIFWMPPVHEGKGGNQSTFESVIRFFWLVEYIVLIIFALGSLAFIRPILLQGWILYACIIFYTGIHMIFYIIFRYRLSIMPIICLLSGYCLWQIYQQFITKASGKEKNAAILNV